jgi:hypothetical protein
LEFKYINIIDSLFTIEIEGQGTPIFKCAGSKREFYKDIQPKKIMLDVDPFTLSHDIIEVIIFLGPV